MPSDVTISQVTFARAGTDLIIWQQVPYKRDVVRSEQALAAYVQGCDPKGLKELELLDYRIVVRSEGDEAVLRVQAQTGQPYER